MHLNNTLNVDENRNSGIGRWQGTCERNNFT